MIVDLEYCPGNGSRYEIVATTITVNGRPRWLIAWLSGGRCTHIAPDHLLHWRTLMDRLELQSTHDVAPILAWIRDHLAIEVGMPSFFGPDGLPSGPTETTFEDF